MGFAVEDDKNNPFKKVCFSVVHHPDNTSLDKSMNEYKALINNSNKFTSKDVIDAAETVKNENINTWIEWYRELYKV